MNLKNLKYFKCYLNIASFTLTTLITWTPLESEAVETTLTAA